MLSRSTQDNPDALESSVLKEAAIIPLSDRALPDVSDSQNVTAQQRCQPDATPDAEYPTGRKLLIIVGSLCSLVILAGLDANLVATAVPAITDHFHTVADIGWYFSAYSLVFCSFQFLFGKLNKLFPIDRVLLSSIAVFMLGSTLCATATSSTMLVVGRAVSGLGCAGAASAHFTLQTHLFPLHKRPIFSSIFGVVEAVASLSGPVLGGILTQYLSWRWCFWILLPIGATAFGVTLCFMPSYVSGPEVNLSWTLKLKRLDLLGTLVFLPSMTCLFLALGWAGLTYPWSSATVIGLLVSFVALLAAFLCNQHMRQNEATVPPRLAKHRDVLAGALFSFCNSSSMVVLEYYAPTYFQAVHGYSSARSGYMLLPMILGSTIGFLVAGRGTTAVGYYKPFMLASSILSPIAAGLMTTWKINTSAAKLIACLGMAGFGGGLGNGGPILAVQCSLDRADVPLGIAIILFAGSFGPALSIPVAQNIFTGYLKSHLRGIPGFNATSVEDIGLTDLRIRLGPNRYEDILHGLNDSLSKTWYLAVAEASMTIIGSVSIGYHSVKKKQS